MTSTTDIKPVRTATDYRKALAQIDRILLSAPADRDVDTLDIITALVHQYEEEHLPMDPPDPISAILFRLEQQGMTRADLQHFLGSRQRTSEVLSRRRPLSITMIQALHSGLGVSADILIRGARPAGKHSIKRRPVKASTRASARTARAG